MNAGNFDQRNLSTGVYTPELLTAVGINAAIGHARSTDNLALEIHAPVNRGNHALLESFGFVLSGTTTKNTEVLGIFRLQLRRIGENCVNPELSTGLAPVLAPSSEEQSAIASLDHSRYSDEVIERNVARIIAESAGQQQEDNSLTLAKAALRTQHHRESR